MTALFNTEAPLDIVTNKLSADFTIVTPTMAAEWLKSNNKNRNMRGVNVNMYARDMASGSWIVTGQAIQFDRDGNLIDGQHRLMGIVRSDVPVMMLVVRGLDPRAQAVIDAGAKRTAADALNFRGVPNATRVAATARLCLSLANGANDARNSASFTNTEIDDYRFAHPEVETAVRATGELHKYIPLTPSVLAYCWMTLSTVDSFACAEFFKAIANNATNGIGDPRNTLLLRLRSDKDKGIRPTAQEQICLVIRAWNYWRKGEQVKYFRELKDKSIPKAI